MECLSQLVTKVLIHVIDDRWLDSYDVAAVLSLIRCPTLLLQADPQT